MSLEEEVSRIQDQSQQSTPLQDKEPWEQSVRSESEPELRTRIRKEHNFLTLDLDLERNL